MFDYGFSYSLSKHDRTKKARIPDLLLMNILIILQDNFPFWMRGTVQLLIKSVILEGETFIQLQNLKLKLRI